MATLKELREAANRWAAQEKADIAAGRKTPPLTSTEKIMAENKSKDKPLKTALVREVEPGRNRGRLAAQTREARKNYPGEQLQSNQDAKLDRLQSAAETGEAQAFVGQMKPGVAARTAAHTLQSREFNYPPQNQSKDLGRAVTNVIRSEQGRPDGGSLMALAKKRAKEGRSVAGPDAPSVPKNRRGTYKGKPAGGRGGVSGSAPDVTIDMDMGDLTKAPGWKKRLEPGDL